MSAPRIPFLPSMTWHGYSASQLASRPVAQHSLEDHVRSHCPWCCSLACLPDCPAWTNHNWYIHLFNSGTQYTAFVCCPLVLQPAAGVWVCRDGIPSFTQPLIPRLLLTYSLEAMACVSEPNLQDAKKDWLFAPPTSPTETLFPSPPAQRGAVGCGA